MGRETKNARTFRVTDSEAGERLDRWLAGRSALGLSRALAQRWIDADRVRVNGAPALKRRIVRPGDEVEVLPPQRAAPVESAKVPLDVIFEDDVLLVVNKPPHMVVHPAREGDTGTLVHALRAHTDRLSTAGGEDRPGIVHRLDKGTSGILVVAKTDEAHRVLSRQFKARTVEKIYQAIVWGDLPRPTGVIAAPLGRHRRHRKKMAVRSDGGREADTAYEVEEALPFVNLARLKPGTGRTHQLRVHLAYLGHPIFGDPNYGGRRVPGRVSAKDRETLDGLLKRCPRQALHAGTLSFDHPSDGRRCRYEARLAEDMNTLVSQFRSWMKRSP